MDEDMLDCIRALAENRIQDAKDKAIICCINDTTKKKLCIHATASFFVFISDKLSFNHFFDCCKQLIVRLVCRNIRIFSLDGIGTFK